MRYLLLLLVFASGCSQSKEVAAWWDFTQASRSLVQNKGEEGLAAYGRSLDAIPQKARTLANMGLAFQILQNPEKARSTYQSSLEIKSVDLEAQFMSHFNLGMMYGLEQNTDAALKEYQAALALAPTSNEVKTNIELLLQQEKENQQQQQQQQQNKNQNKDQKQDQKQDQNKQGKDQDKNKDQNKDKNKDQNGDQNKDQNKDQDQDQKNKAEQKYQDSPKYKPREFKGEMHPEDVQRILGELKQQEQKIRSEYNKKKSKEVPRDKDW